MLSNSGDLKIRKFTLSNAKGITFPIGKQQVNTKEFKSFDEFVKGIFRCFPFSNDIVKALKTPTTLFKVENTKLQSLDIKDSVYLKEHEEEISTQIVNIWKGCQKLWELQEKLNTVDLDSSIVDISDIEKKLIDCEKEIYGYETKKIVENGFFENYKNSILAIMSEQIRSQAHFSNNEILFQALTAISDKNHKKNEIIDLQTRLFYDRGEAFLLASIDKSSYDKIESDETRFSICDFDIRSADIELMTIDAVASDKAAAIYIKNQLVEKYSKEYFEYMENLVKQGMTPVYNEKALQERVKEYLNDHVQSYFQMEILKLKMGFINVKLKSLEEKRKMSFRSDAERKQIEKEIQSCQVELKKLREDQVSLKMRFEDNLSKFISNCFRHAQDDDLDIMYNKLNIARPSKFTDSIKPFIEKTLVEQFSDYACYIPSFSALSNIAKSTLKGGIVGATIGGVSLVTPLTTAIGLLSGFVVGTSGGITDMATQLISSTASYTKSTIAEKVYGKFHAAYDRLEFLEPSTNMIKMFDDDKINAEIVNAFYVNQLFKLDVILSNLSETKKKEEASQESYAVFTTLKEHYEKTRGGQFTSKEAKEALQKDLSLILMLLHRSLIEHQVTANRYALEKTQQSRLSVLVPKSMEEPKKTSKEKVVPPSEESLALTTTSMALTKASSKSESAEMMIKATLQNKKLEKEFAQGKIIEGGISNELVELKDLITLIADYILNGEHLSDLEPDQRKMLKIKENSMLPIKRDLSFYLKESFRYSDLAFIDLYLYELTTSTMGNLDAKRLKEEMNKPFVNFENKSFWHLMVDWKKGKEFTEWFLNKKGKQEFEAFFDPICTYLGMNVIEYAMSKKNFDVARILMKQMINGSYKNVLTKCFAKALNDNELKVFSDILYTTRKSESDKLKPWVTTFVHRADSTIEDKETQKQYEILAALWLYKERHSHLPSNEAEWNDFLWAVCEKGSSQAYLTVDCFQERSDKEKFFPTVAKAIVENYAKAREKMNINPLVTPVFQQKRKIKHLSTEPTILRHFTKFLKS